ncbi:hypothetical protein, partial [Alicycliphilus denitrificans]|uniref:hypothetical protein n=1 Tax=Alicycliphilus denitrificans TaxID=179636 RepID=UPI001CA53C86
SGTSCFLVFIVLTDRPAYAGGGLSVYTKFCTPSGACKFGVQSWCAFVGIDLNLQTISLARLLAGFEKQPLVEVRRTVLHVIAEHRRSHSTRRG